MATNDTSNVYTPKLADNKNSDGSWFNEEAHNALAEKTTEIDMKEEMEKNPHSFTPAQREDHLEQKEPLKSEKQWE